MATIQSPLCGYNMAYCVELRGEDLSCYLYNIRSVGLRQCLACQQSVFQRYHSEKHLSAFYPQDLGESQLALKLRYCHPMYRPIAYKRLTVTGHFVASSSSFFFLGIAIFYTTAVQRCLFHVYCVIFSNFVDVFCM